MNEEQWKRYPHDGRYEVSDHGSVRSFVTGEPRPLTPTRYSGGRAHVKLYIGGVVRGVHRLVLETFVGPMPAGHEVRHLNGKAADNRLENLAYGARSENVRDAVMHGTHPMSSKKQCAKGHDFDARNAKQRFCRTCRAEANSLYLLRKKAGQ